MNENPSEQDYWRHQLKGVFSSDCLPPTKRRPGASAFLRRNHTITLERSALRHVAVPSADPDLQWVALAVTGLNLLQYRVSGDHATCAGCLLNTNSRALNGRKAQLLPVVSRCAMDRTATELTRDALTILNEAAVHGGRPIDEICTWTGHACSLNPTAMFQTIVVVELGSVSRESRVGCTAEQVEDWRAELLERDLVVFASAMEGGLAFRFQYDEELWAEDDIARLGRDFTRVLTTLAQGPTLPVERLIADLSFESYQNLPGRCDRGEPAQLGRRHLRMVESYLRRMSAIEDVAVLEIEDENGAVVSCAFVVAATPPSLDVIRRYLSLRCPIFLLPSKTVSVDRIRRNCSEEIDEAYLRAAIAPNSAPTSSLSDAERYLVQVWSEVLKLDDIPIEGHFIELGGHSVLATQVVSRIHRDLGLSLAVRDVFNQPILADFAKLLDGANLKLSAAANAPCAAMEVFEV